MRISEFPDPAAIRRSAENRTEETVNYEISKKVINHVRETGLVKRLSVAVLVDGTYNANDDGRMIYQPRITGGTGSAGQPWFVAPSVSMRSAATPSRSSTCSSPTWTARGPGSQSLLFGLDKNDLFRSGQYLVVVIVGVLILLLVVRPLMSGRR